MKATTGAFDGQQFAPLIFPTLDKTSQAHDGKKKGAFDRAGDWVDDWTDKRAQTKWKESNQDLATASALPKAEFRSRYADPSHPAASGDVVAFLTGGRWRYGHEKENKQLGPEAESQDPGGKKEAPKSPEPKEKESVQTIHQPEVSQLLQARPEDSTSSTTLPETAEADGLQQPISEIIASADKYSKPAVPDSEEVDVEDSNLTKSEKKKLKEQEAKEERKQKEREKKERRAQEKEERKQKEEAKKESRRVEKQLKEDDKKARKEREKDASLSSGSMSSLLKKVNTNFQLHFRTCANTAFRMFYTW
ncbi:hypothetical protein CTRI78_v004591 [Colletotrichum trifolii]|uniref:Reticulocyte-binding protein 2-like protein a n=1 Tax=Colletotrichum trifolii TaxID=5466 RepID=A0A4R8RNS5_COLTR|nr:hypothetical protein CTRI78_v004591 [Colletotrichum trifolii]